jgi:hypothetical protein
MLYTGSEQTYNWGKIITQAGGHINSFRQVAFSTDGSLIAGILLQQGYVLTFRGSDGYMLDVRKYSSLCDTAVGYVQS